MKPQLKQTGIWKLLADNARQNELKRLKANMCVRLRDSVGADCQPALRNIGGPLANTATDWIKRIVFLSLTTFALVEVPIAVADKKSEKETEGETVHVCDDLRPCVGGGLRINARDSNGKCTSICVSVGGGGGFDIDGGDMGQAPVDPCKLVPGGCGGSRPDGDGKPDDADEEDTEPCGKNDTFGTYEDSEETDCGKASAVCETEGNNAFDDCWFETKFGYEIRCQAGLQADGSKTTPIPCVLLNGEIDCAGFGDFKEIRVEAFSDCLNGYFNSALFSTLRDGHCNNIATIGEAYCQNQAAEQCREECLDNGTSRLSRAGDRLHGDLTGAVSGVDIVSEANMTEMNDSERALLQNLKDRTELGASVLHAMAIELFKSGYEDLGVRIFEQYSILYPDKPKSSNRVPEGYRSRGVRETSENASELEGKLRRQ